MPDHSRPPIPFHLDPVILADGDRMMRRINPTGVDAHAPARPTHFLPQGDGRQTPAVRPARPRPALAARVVRAVKARAADYWDTPRRTDDDDTPGTGATWQQIVPDAVGRNVLRLLFENGFEYTGRIEGNRAYLTRGRTQIALVVDLDDSARITHLVHGNVSIPVRAAAEYVLELTA